MIEALKHQEVSEALTRNIVAPIVSHFEEQLTSRHRNDLIERDIENTKLKEEVANLKT